MSRILKLFLLLIFSLSGSASQAKQGSLRVEVTAARESYHIGEPIEMELAIQNVAEEEIEVFFEFPSSMGLKFRCAQKGIGPNRALASAQAIGCPPPTTRFAPHEERVYAFALNRYLAFSEPGRYSVEFDATYVRYIGTLDEFPVLKATGEVTIAIEPGIVDAKLLNKYGNRARAADREEKVEMLDLLLWFEDAAVVELLTSTACQVSPRLGSDAIHALARFLEDDKAKAGICKIAERGDSRTLVAALNVLQMNDVQLPEEFKVSVLYCGESVKVCRMLRHLADFGTEADIPLLQRLVYDPNAQVAQLAKEVITKLKQ